MKLAIMCFYNRYETSCWGLYGQKFLIAVVQYDAACMMAPFVVDSPQHIRDTTMM